LLRLFGKHERFKNTKKLIESGLVIYLTLKNKD